MKLILILLLLLSLSSCARWLDGNWAGGNVRDVDETILTEQEAFNHYRGDRPDVYHREPF